MLVPDAPLSRIGPSCSAPFDPNLFIAVDDLLVRLIGSVVSLSLVGLFGSIIAVGLILTFVVVLVRGVEVG